MNGELNFKELVRNFPRLNPANCKKTSEKDKKYNCVGWAIGDLTYIWPALDGWDHAQYSWPEGLGNGEDLENFIHFFKLHGYELCEGEDVEAGFEKIALFVTPSNTFTHVAKQLGEREWTSKLGGDEDIYHESPSVLTGLWIGQVKVYMRRQKN